VSPEKASGGPANGSSPTGSSTPSGNGERA
jgi:hypothetical protein